MTPIRVRSRFWGLPQNRVSDLGSGANQGQKYIHHPRNTGTPCGNCLPVVSSVSWPSAGEVGGSCPPNRPPTGPNWHPTEAWLGVDFSLNEPPQPPPPPVPYKSPPTSRLEKVTPRILGKWHPGAPLAPPSVTAAYLSESRSAHQEGWSCNSGIPTHGIPGLQFAIHFHWHPYCTDHAPMLSDIPSARCWGSSCDELTRAPSHPPPLPPLCPGNTGVYHSCGPSASGWQDTGACIARQ